MKKTGSEMPSPEGAPSGDEGSAEIIERARLQADVAQQRVRLAKEELKRARKRLKEAKREAKRARKYATLARKDWKKARRKARKEGSQESQKPDAPAGRQRRKMKRKLAGGNRTRRTRGSATKSRGTRRSRASK